MNQNKVDQEGCYYRVNSILSELHNVHLHVFNMQNNENNMKYTSVGFYWFGNELRISSCLDGYEKYLGWKVIKIADASIQDVIDIRWNNGGYRYLMENMLKKYKEQFKDKQIDLIIGKGTFSSGYMLIEDCYENCDHVKLYGEETGQSIHNCIYARGLKLSSLPWLLYVPFAKGYEKMIVEKYGDVVKGVTPDVSADQTYEDYMNGIDTVYQRIKKNIELSKFSCGEK